MRNAMASEENDNDSDGIVMLEEKTREPSAAAGES